jgi:hypothetical protein
MEERTIKHIASECIHYIDINGNLTPECDTRDKANDLALMMCLSLVYPDYLTLDLVMSN